MFAAPAEGTLKDFMEFAETGFADHEQSPPNQRTHATEHYAELINRNRRYGRFRHASSLPKPHTYSLESDPPESPALQDLLPDPERFLVERFGLGVLAHILVQRSQVVEAGRCVAMFWPKKLLSD